MKHVMCQRLHFQSWYACYYTAFITIYKHYYAEISMVLAGYSITSIVQNVYWLLKSYFTCIWTPEYHNQVDKFTRIVCKNAYSLHIQLAIFSSSRNIENKAGAAHSIRTELFLLPALQWEL